MRQGVRSYSIRYVFLVVLSLIFCTGQAQAEVIMTAVPVLGRAIPPSGHWSSISVRLENTETRRIEGRVEINAGSYHREMIHVAPFVLPPQGTTLLRIPYAGTTSWEIKADAYENGKTKPIAGTTLRTATPQTTLIDVHDPPRLVGMLRGVFLWSRPGVGTHSTLKGHELTVGNIWFDPASGDPILPTRGSEYAAASLVLMHSDTFSRLRGEELGALVDFVLGGGSLALVIARPEDLRNENLTRMMGDEVDSTKHVEHLVKMRSREVIVGTETLPGSPSTRSGSKLKSVGWIYPGDALKEVLISYEGGNLVASDFGASAPYGLGEIHLLAFDPTVAPAIDDPWAKSRIVELANHSWLRRDTMVLASGKFSKIGSSRSNSIRKEIDPNENARWAIVVSAFLLIIYATIAGPINFSSASKSGKPLRAIKTLSILSAGMFFVIVLLGIAARGIRGQSRHLTLIEAGGGMSRGTIRRFRGFFSSGTKDLSVSATDSNGVISVVEDADSVPKLVVERTGIRLEQIATKPWQTVMVKEDSFTNIGQGVSLIRAPNDVRVVNHTGKNLRGVLVHVPKVGMFYHQTIKDGASVMGTKGEPTCSIRRMGYRHTHRSSALDVECFESDVNKASPGLSDAWSAFANEVSGNRSTVTWWPADVPVVLAQIDGGEGQTTDNGLPIKKDRTLLRVLGYGGQP
jgi:hypothetical protein